MRSLGLSLLFVFSTSLAWQFPVLAQALTEGQPQPSDAEEAKQFAGTWKLISLERDGKKAPATEIENVRWVVSGREYTYKHNNGMTNQGTFKLDRDRRPRLIETSYADGPDRGKSLLRAYEWIDADKVRFCTPGPAEKAPTDFTALAGSGRELAVWGRVKTP